MAENTIILQLTINIEVSSSEYDSVESIIEELNNDLQYEIPSTENVDVLVTDLFDIEEMI